MKLPFLSRRMNELMDERVALVAGVNVLTRGPEWVVKFDRGPVFHWGKNMRHGICRKHVL